VERSRRARNGATRVGTGRVRASCSDRCTAADRARAPERTIRWFDGPRARGRLACRIGDDQRPNRTRPVLSSRTVEKHLEHAMGKLGIGSRVQLVSWMLRKDMYRALAIFVVVPTSESHGRAYRFAIYRLGGHSRAVSPVRKQTGHHRSPSGAAADFPRHYASRCNSKLHHSGMITPWR
jgi:hypothetical protein